MRRGERFERSAIGQLAISVVMVVLVTCVLAWNLPDGPVHDRAVRIAGPVVRAMGLEQNWALFAPDPRAASVGVYADITFRDGTTTRWRPPDRGLLLAPYRTYRWQKYVEQLRADDKSQLWQPTAQWLARRYARADNPVASVVLVRTFRGVVVPGSGAARPPAQEFTFYRLDLP